MLTPLNCNNISLVKRLLYDYETIPAIASVYEYRHYMEQLQDLIETTGDDPNDPTLSMCHALVLRLEDFEQWAIVINGISEPPR